MAMPQRDDPPSRCALRRTSTVEAIKRLDVLLEYAVMHGDEEEAERIRAELHKLTESARLAILRDFLLPLLMNWQVKIKAVYKL
jgi:hypothetical protein